MFAILGNSNSTSNWLDGGNTDFDWSQPVTSAKEDTLELKWDDDEDESNDKNGNESDEECPIEIKAIQNDSEPENNGKVSWTLMELLVIY